MKRIAEQQMRKEDMEEEDSSESTPTMVGQFEVASESVLKGRVIKLPKSRLNRTSNGDPAGISVPPPPPLARTLISVHSLTRSISFCRLLHFPQRQIALLDLVLVRQRILILLLLLSVQSTEAFITYVLIQ